MTNGVGYYVHHQGEGHLARALAIAQQAPDRFTLLGTGLNGRTGDIAAVDLPDDQPSDRDRYEPAPRALHYAPIDHDGVRARVAAVAAWIARKRPSLLVVDVSVEIAMLARLAATPTVYVRLSGRRLDVAHREAFLGARALLAPFAAGLECEDTPVDIRARSFYAPGLVTRPRGRGVGFENDTVLGVIGRGGAIGDGEPWAAAARATPDRLWRVIGPCTAPRDAPANLQRLGWVDDAAERISTAEVVVGAAGDGLVAAVIAARRPFVCIPEDRPYDEQRCKAERLAALGAAVVPDGWPSSNQWPEVIAQALRVDAAALSQLDAADGAKRAAGWLIDVADGQVRPRS